MITLKKVTLRGDCCLTNAGIQKLGSLTRLEELKLIGCSGFAEKGLGFARELPKLNSLTVVECYQVCLPQLNIQIHIISDQNAYLFHVRKINIICSQTQNSN